MNRCGSDDDDDELNPACRVVAKCRPTSMSAALLAPRPAAAAAARVDGVV